LGRLGWKRMAYYSQLVNLPISQYYLSRTSTPFSFFNQAKNQIYTNEFKEAIENSPSDKYLTRLFEEVSDQSILNQMLYVDTKTWLPDDLLVKADKMSMTASVELRVPLLDFRVLEFAAALPQKYKVRGWELKRALKGALEESIPAEIINRKKTGFPVPYAKWLRQDLREYVHDTLLSSNAALSAYFSKDFLSRTVEGHERGEGLSKEVFSLLVLELWHNTFLKGEGYSP